MSELLASNIINAIRNQVWADVVDTDEIDETYFSHSIDAYDSGVADALESVEKCIRQLYGE